MPKTVGELAGPQRPLVDHCSRDVRACLPHPARSEPICRPDTYLAVRALQLSNMTVDLIGAHRNGQTIDGETPRNQCRRDADTRCRSCAPGGDHLPQDHDQGECGDQAAKAPERTGLLNGLYCPQSRLLSRHDQRPERNRLDAILKIIYRSSHWCGTTLEQCSKGIAARADTTHHRRSPPKR